MTIGTLAASAGVGVETIRYYQRRGLLSIPSMPLGGRRQYAPAVLHRIAFIRRAQDLGFTLDEIKEMLLIEDGSRCGDGRDFAQRKLEELGLRVAELNRMRRKLGDLVKRCDRNKGAPCPFIESLKDRDES